MGTRICTYFEDPIVQVLMGQGDRRRGNIDNEYGMTTVDLSNIGYKDEPFVLAKDVNRVFYVNDMSTKPKRGKNDNDSTKESKGHIVLSGKESSWESRTSRTCQKIMKSMTEFRPSK